jgi:hypothetical protein
MEAGYEVPETGRFTDATATELLIGADGDDFPSSLPSSRHGAAGGPPSKRRLSRPRRRAVGDPALSNLTLAAMGEIDLEIAGPEVRALADDPARRGFALLARRPWARRAGDAVRS